MSFLAYALRAQAPTKWPQESRKPWKPRTTVAGVREVQSAILHIVRSTVHEQHVLSAYVRRVTSSGPTAGSATDFDAGPHGDAITNRRPPNPGRLAN